MLRRQETVDQLGASSFTDAAARGRGGGRPAEGKLIAVSNRVSLPSAGAPPGGLALALSEALAEKGGTWIGWSGALPDEVPAAPLDLRTEGAATYGLLDLPAAAYDGFYEGYANGVLWPVFHNRPEVCAYSADAFDAYRSVNRDYAAAVAHVAGPRDRIWVHDYHFLPLADALREAGVTATTGLFLHIPFPHAQTFRTIPEAQELARALSAYDVIAVQTLRDAQNLAETLAELGEGEITHTPDGPVVTAFGRTLPVRARPIGIDAAAIRAELDRTPSVDVARFLEKPAGGFGLVGIDRLDYSKGIPQKLAGFEAYLADDPQRAADTVLTQIAPISRGSVPAYRRTRKEVEAIAGRISGTFAQLSGSPLRLLTQPYDRRDVAHLMAAADAALVTPIADGMNLVAKEFVAVQDPDDPGVLILSEFAGAAERMTDALLVNPQDAAGIAAAIRQARAMPLQERRERHRRLMQVVEETAIDRWTARCLADLERA